MAGEGNGVTINDEVGGRGGWSVGEGGFGANEQGFGFAAVEFQEVPAHPAPDVLEAVGERGGGGACWVCWKC